MKQVRPPAGMWLRSVRYLDHSYRKFRWQWHSMARASKQIKVAMLGHPPRSRQMCLIRAVRPIQLRARIDSQDDTCNLAPVRPFRIRVQ